MDKPLIPDLDVECSGPPVFHIPTEDISTLYSCAFVCRDWRVRAQRMLFYRVQLSDTTSLHRLSTILDTGQHLRSYVHEVVLTGNHLHTTASIFALFPAVFAGKLPNVKRISIIHILPGTPWFSRTSDLPAKAKALPYIPLHLRFPNFLSSFTALSSLYLAHTTFHSFSEFARMLHGLPNLENFACTSVRWITPGGSHPNADFTKQPDWAAGRGTLPPFAPKVRVLSLHNMAMYGAERLIGTRGPHLKWLVITIPLSDNPEERANAGAIDLSPCIELQRLDLSITPQFSMDTHAGFIKELLASWKPQHLEPVLMLRVYQESQFTRCGFADVLHGLGTITETWFQTVEEPSPASRSEDHHCVQYHLCVEIFDWEAERDWWSDHVDSCFPTWLQLGRLSWVFRTSFDEYFQWAIEEKSSPSATIPQCQVEGGADSSSGSPSKGDLSHHPSDA